MQQDQIDAITRAVQAANAAPIGAIIIFGIMLLLSVTGVFGMFLRMASKNFNPMTNALNAVNENFSQVLTSSQQATERYEERVEKHEEASDRFLEVMEGYRKAGEANTAVLIELKKEIQEQARVNADRRKEDLAFFGSLINGVKQDVAVHDKHATDRYAEIGAQLKTIQEEIHTVLKDIDREIKALAAKPSPLVDFTPMTSRLDAITAAIEKMAAQFVGLVVSPIIESGKET